jgi:hypothetical protein
LGKEKPADSHADDECERHGENYLQGSHVVIPLRQNQLSSGLRTDKMGQKIHKGEVHAS